MDFLLECIGFPPHWDLHQLAEKARRNGEPVAWRGPRGEHLRQPLGGGLELRMDREEGTADWTLLPYFDSPHRLRVAVHSLQRPPDSPFDALLKGWADPPIASDRDTRRKGSWPLSALLCDARRLPGKLPRGHVLALSMAGFALAVDYVGPNDGVSDRRVLELPRGAWLQPLGGARSPGGCMELSLRVREVRRVTNPITGVSVDVLECDVPGRPLHLFVSRWQLEEEGLPVPRPGWRIEGTFLLTGRICGGLPSPARRLGRVFG